MISAFKIQKLFDSGQKKIVSFLIIGLLIGVVLESFSLGLFIPVVSTITDVNYLREILIDYKEFDIFNLINLKDDELVIFCLVVLILFFFIKTVFLILLTYFQHSFLSNFTVSISDRLFSGYLAQPISFFMNVNSSDKMKILITETNYVKAYLFSLIIVVTEISITFSILITLLLIEPVGAIMVIFFFSFFSLLFYFITKKKMESWGKLREKLDKKLNKNDLDALSAIKELKISSRENFFLDRHFNLNLLKSNVYKKHLTTSQISRYYLEIITVFGVVLFFLFAINQKGNISEVLPTISLFLVASFRMIPSLNRIISSAQAIKYYKSSIDLISNEISQFDNHAKEIKKTPISFNDKLILENIHFRYKERWVLQNVDLEIKKGSMIGVIGQSGSGKSTLVDIIVGLIYPTKGKVYLDNKLIGSDNASSWRKLIGYVPQNIFLKNDSIEENIAFGIEHSKINSARLEESIRLSQSKEFIDSLPDGIKTNVGERGVQLSGGQLQRIGIARALYAQPEFIIFDEATSALDPKTENEIIETLNLLKNLKTIIIITHRKDSLKNCDQVYELKNKKLNHA